MLSATGGKAFLKNHADRGAQGFQIELAQVAAIHAHPAGLQVW